MSSRFRFFFFFLSSSLSDLRGSYDGVDAADVTETAGIDGILDLGRGGGWTEGLRSSPFGKGVTGFGEVP